MENDKNNEDGMVTVMFAHLERKSCFEAGDCIMPKQRIGYMGNTGLSTGAHLHIGNAKGVHKKPWHLHDVESGDICTDIRQLNYHLDEDLFHGAFKITTHYGDPEYQHEWGKVHFGYDLSIRGILYPWPIYWNRTAEGIVTFADEFEAYGNVVLICYDTRR